MLRTSLAPLKKNARVLEVELDHGRCYSMTAYGLGIEEVARWLHWILQAFVSAVEKKQKCATKGVGYAFSLLPNVAFKSLITKLNLRQFCKTLLAVVIKPYYKFDFISIFYFK